MYSCGSEAMPFGKFTSRRVWNIDGSSVISSKATGSTTESTIMDKLRDMKNNFRG